MNHNPTSGRCEFEVAQVTDTTLRGRVLIRIRAVFYHLTEASNAFWLVILVSVQAGGGTDTAHSDQFFVFLPLLLKSFARVHRQSRRQFFVCERFGYQRPYLTDQNLGGFGTGEACSAIL